MLNSLMPFAVRLEDVLLFARSESPPRHNAGASSTLDAAQMQSFEAFFRRYERQITAYLYRMLGNEQTALDFSQETFIRAWQNFERLQEPVTARGWLYRVATNLSLRHLEQHKARIMQPLDEWLPGASDPGRRIAERDLVQRSLLTLTPKQRSALMLYEVYGLPCEEIGAILHLSRDAVKMVLFRGRKQFRQHYLHEESNV